MVFSMISRMTTRSADRVAPTRRCLRILPMIGIILALIPAQLDSQENPSVRIKPRVGQTGIPFDHPPVFVPV